jgi:hypothetical protein
MYSIDRKNISSKEDYQARTVWPTYAIINLAIIYFLVKTACYRQNCVAQLPKLQFLQYLTNFQKYSYS